MGAGGAEDIGCRWSRRGRDEVDRLSRGALREPAGDAPPSGTGEGVFGTLMPRRPATAAAALGREGGRRSGRPWGWRRSWRVQRLCLESDG